jgi:hypothetical protein
MKKLLTKMELFVAALSVLVVFAGCTVQQQTTVAHALTNAKGQIANACAVVQPTLVDLQASLAVPNDTVTKVVSANAAFCAAAANVDPVSAQALINSTIPQLIAGVSALPIAQADKTTIQIALGAASVALSNFLLVYGQQPAAATPASGV